MLAYFYIEVNKDEEAMLLLNEINSDDDVYLQALVQLADLYQAQGLFEVAEQKLIAAKQIDPTEEIIDFALGEWFFSTGDYVKAITYYEIIKSLNIADVSLSERLADCLHQTGK